MKLIVLDQSAEVAADKLWELSPRKATKQLVDCCKLLLGCGLVLPRPPGMKGTTKRTLAVRWMLQDTMHILWVVDYAYHLLYNYEIDHVVNHPCHATVLAASRMFEKRERAKSVSHAFLGDKNEQHKD